MLRTQIYLPEDLRREIDTVRSWKGESLSDYMRKAATSRVEEDKKRKLDFKKLANRIVGSLKGHRSPSEVEKWLREIREDRKSSDERLEKRWAEARAANKKGKGH